MKKIIQIKNTSLEVKDIDTKKRIVKGYFSSFGTKDADGDIFQHGAFTKSITEKGPDSLKPRIKHLFNHWDAVGVLQELSEDQQGLYFVSKMGRHTLGDDVLKMYEDGIITEHSVGFQTVQQHKEADTNIITEARLWEGSSLDKWGANENTPVVKSIDKIDVMLKRIAKLEKAIADGTYSDEMFSELEIQLKYMQQYLTDTTQAGHEAPPEPVKGNLQQIKSFINSINF